MMMTNETKQMTTYEACAIIEGFDGQQHTREDMIEAWQSLIDSGVVWQLQGAYGRMARSLIDGGILQEAMR